MAFVFWPALKTHRQRPQNFLEILKFAKKQGLRCVGMTQLHYGTNAKIEENFSNFALAANIPDFKQSLFKFLHSALLLTVGYTNEIQYIS